MHGEVAENVAALRAGAFNAPAFECDSREFLDVEKLWTAQMIVALFNLRIDAPHVDLRRDRGILRMFPIDFDPAAEARELAVSRAEELMHTETNRRTRRIELVALLRRGGRADRNEQQHSDIKLEPARPRAAEETRRGRRGSKRNRLRNRIHLNPDFHLEMFFAFVASVFNSGVRESGSRPNRFPNANAGSAFNRV